MNSPALTELPPRTLRLEDRDVAVKVRESTRARTSRILVGAQRPLEIIVPQGTSGEEIDSQLRARRQWISQKLGIVARERSRPAALGLNDAGVAWLAGTRVPLIEQEAARASAQLRGESLLLRGPDAGERRRALMRWYRRQARAALTAVAREEADRLGLSFRSLAVRDQRTRWGSCSPAGNLSFSWRLVLAPPEVLRYVVIHELCHLAVPNHSKAFWRQLEAAVPGWQQQAEWLREHGAEVRSYQPDGAAPDG